MWFLFFMVTLPSWQLKLKKRKKTKVLWFLLWEKKKKKSIVMINAPLPAGSVIYNHKTQHEWHVGLLCVCCPLPYSPWEQSLQPFLPALLPSSSRLPARGKIREFQPGWFNPLLSSLWYFKKTLALTQAKLLNINTAVVRCRFLCLRWTRVLGLYIG